MRNNTTIHIVAVVVLMLAGAAALAQPAPFPPTVDLEITYPHFPSASGTYTFAFDDDQYLHSALPTTFGTIEWAGPFVIQPASGAFVHADEGTHFVFHGVWLEDGAYRVNSVMHPTITVTGPGNVPEPAALGLAGFAGLLLRRRHAALR